MKLLLLFIGIACYIAGLFFLFLKDGDKQEKKGSQLMLAGALLMIANCFYFVYSISNKIEMWLVVVVILFTILTAAAYYYKEKPEWSVFSTFFIAIVLHLTFGGKLAPVTLDNGVIKMEGHYGRFFNVSDIQSIDTVSIMPKTVGTREGGKTLTTLIGNYHLENESKMAKLRFYRYKPPYIKIRMNNNSLFIFNFKEPDETVAFYNRIKDVINSN